MDFEQLFVMLLLVHFVGFVIALFLFVVFWIQTVQHSSRNASPKIPHDPKNLGSSAVYNLS